MLATADCKNHYAEQIIYESEWTENIPSGVSWLNLLTAQSIPEETDGIDSPCSPQRNNSGSNCSSTSVESCYVVLEIQRPRSVDETPSKADEDEEEEEEEVEEEEEMEEEIEELHFAQMKYDNHQVKFEQCAVPMTIETPIEEYAVEFQQEQVVPIKEYAKVTEPVVFETANDILFHKAKTLSRFTKRMKAMSYVSTKEQNFSTSSEDESFEFTKLKTIRKINEYRQTAISAVAAEQQKPIQQSNSVYHSAASLDSIENISSPSSPIRTRITTNFSNLSTQRPLNPIQNQRPNPTMGTTTLIRTFAFDRACMDKYVRTQENKNEPIEIKTVPVCEPIIKKMEIEPPVEINKHTEPLPPSNDPLNSRSFTNDISTPFYIGSEESTVDESELEHAPSMPRSTSMSHSISKVPSSIMRSVKTYARTVATDYYSTLSNNGNLSAEPKLLQVKYLDGRLPLRDDHARQSFQKPQTISGSISKQFNRLGLSKMYSTQDLSSQTTSFNCSYRKRMLNHFRTLIENNSPEPSQLPQTRPWQHKTISELFNEKKKYKANRRQ